MRLGPRRGWCGDYPKIPTPAACQGGVWRVKNRPALPCNEHYWHLTASPSSPNPRTPTRLPRLVVHHYIRAWCPTPWIVVISGATVSLWLPMSAHKTSCFSLLKNQYIYNNTSSIKGNYAKFDVTLRFELFV